MTEKKGMRMSSALTCTCSRVFCSGLYYSLILYSTNIHGDDMISVAGLEEAGGALVQPGSSGG